MAAPTKDQYADQYQIDPDLRRMDAMRVAMKQNEAGLHSTMMNAAMGNSLISGSSGYNTLAKQIGSGQATAQKPAGVYDAQITKIANGYIVRNSRYGDAGYYCENAAAVGEYVTSQLVIMGCQDE